MAKIDQLFEALMTQGGSDLHLEQGQPPKIRVHGHLEALSGHDVLTENHLSDLLSEIADKDEWQTFGERGDLDFAYALGDKARFRANFFRHFYGLGAIFRLIPSKILSIDEMGLPSTLKAFAGLRTGLILVTGPTGSGKSTTLAAIIDHINTNTNKRIITIEEPVEFTHPVKGCLITHREVGHDTDSFTNGLRSAIKSDVNIILVGEMRDPETIELALTAAEMGIVVFGTLHTNSAAKAVDRVIDAFPSSKKNQIRASLANSLKGVVAQQLVRSADGARRWAAHEILFKTSAMTSLIMAGETMRLNSEIQMNRGKGMITMDDSLMELVKSGSVTKEDAMMKAIDKAKFQ